MGRRLWLKPRGDEDRTGARGRQFAGELEVIEKRQIVWSGEVDRGDIGDAAVEVGARARLGSGHRGDLADGQRRLRAEELRSEVRVAVHHHASKYSFGGACQASPHAHPGRSTAVDKFGVKC